jgi:DNA-binding Lrp family transcriptional regulator
MEAAVLEAPTPVAAPSRTDRYARAVEASKRIRWDIDRDVLRGRRFDFGKKFLPDGLSKVNALSFLNPDQARFLSQIQGRTYANTFGLVERFIAAKVIDVSRDHQLGDQKALEAMIRFADEEIKHQELFRRVERMSAEGMPEGYTFRPEPNAVAKAVLSKSTWAVLALTCHIELFVLTHYRESIGSADISDVWKDVFLYHWKEESQHAILDELEWRRDHARLSEAQRDQGVTELIELVGAVDGILQVQAPADAEYFVRNAGRTFRFDEVTAIHDVVLRAYRWQYIVSGVQEPRFVEIVKSLTTPAQMERIGKALAPIMKHVGG